MSDLTLEQALEVERAKRDQQREAEATQYVPVPEEIGSSIKNLTNLVGALEYRIAPGLESRNRKKFPWTMPVVSQTGQRNYMIGHCWQTDREGRSFEAKTFCVSATEFGDNQRVSLSLCTRRGTNVNQGDVILTAREKGDRFEHFLNLGNLQQLEKGRFLLGAGQRIRGESVSAMVFSPKTLSFAMEELSSAITDIQQWLSTRNGVTPELVEK